MMKNQNKNKRSLEQLLSEYTISVYESDDKTKSTFKIKPDYVLSYKDIKFKELFLEDKPKALRSNFIFSNIVDDEIEQLGLSRTKKNFTTSPWIVVDIDIKDELIFNKDTTIEQLYNFFKNDQHCFISGYSASGNGLRAIYCMAGDYTITVDINSVYVDEEYKNNENKYTNFIEYMKDNGFKNIEKYLDESFSKNTVQPTFSINNTLPYNFNYDFILLDRAIPYKYKKTILFEKIIPFISSEYDLNILNNSLQNAKISLDYTSMLPWVSALKNIDDDELLFMFFTAFRSEYDRNSKLSYKQFFSSFEGFKNKIKKTHFTGYIVDLKTQLNKHGIKLKKVKKQLEEEEEKVTDIFGREYDIIYKYDKYLSEIENIDLSEKQIVIRADAGAGKTTMALKYCSKQSGIKIFFAPTTILCNQVYAIAKSKYSDCNIKKYYGKKSELDIIDGLDCIIISNFAHFSMLEKQLENINMIAEVMFVDECHRMVDYSVFDHKQPIFPISNKTIYLSATPEPFLMGDKEFFYINFLKNDIKKRELNLIRCANFSQMKTKMAYHIINNLDDSKIKCIFHNNKNVNLKIVDAFSDKDIKFDIIDSKNKDKAYKTLINNQLLLNNTIMTSLVNDGVNINNENIDYVYIIDNNTQSIFDIYQFLQRFRKCTPKVYYFYVGGSYSNDNSIEAFDYKQFDITYNKMKVNVREDIKKIKRGLNEDDTLSLDYIYKNRYNVWDVNKNQLKLKIYEKFKEISRSNIFTFINMLDNYFNTTNIDVCKANKIKTKNVDIDKEWIINNIEKIIKYRNLNINPLFTEEEYKKYEDSYQKINMVISRINRIEKINGDYKLFNLFSNKTQFQNSLRKQELIYNNNNNDFGRGDVDETIKYNYDVLNTILRTGITMVECNEEYKQIENNLLSSFKINFDDIKQINKIMGGFGLNFKRTKQKGKRVYILKFKK